MYNLIAVKTDNSFRSMRRADQFVTFFTDLRCFVRISCTFAQFFTQCAALSDGLLLKSRKIHRRINNTSKFFHGCYGGSIHASCVLKSFEHVIVTYLLGQLDEHVTSTRTFVIITPVWICYWKNSAGIQGCNIQHILKMYHWQSSHNTSCGLSFGVDTCDQIIKFCVIIIQYNIRLEGRFGSRYAPVVMQSWYHVYFLRSSCLITELSELFIWSTESKPRVVHFKMGFQDMGNLPLVTHHCSEESKSIIQQFLSQVVASCWRNGRLWCDILD